MDIGAWVASAGRPLVMGILNATPDSFSDGGEHFGFDNALRHAERLVSEGADIIDIGGESSRPGATPVSLDEELDRVIPVIEAMVKRFPVPLSVDTTKAAVALSAIQAGASIINDISALRQDPLMGDVIAEHDAAVVLMHMQGTPQTMQQSPRYVDPVTEVTGFLRERVAVALAFGIDRGRIIVDPGIGFGKTLEHNLAIIRNLRLVSTLGYPVLLGVSRKRMIEALTGADVNDRIGGTAAFVTYGVLQGAAIHRVHDVAAMRQVCQVAAALRG